MAYRGKGGAKGSERWFGNNLYRCKVNAHYFSAIFFGGLRVFKFECSRHLLENNYFVPQSPQLNPLPTMHPNEPARKQELQRMITINRDKT